MLRVLLLACLSCLWLGCGDGNSSSAQLEQTKTEENQMRLLKAQPPAELKWSLERDNLTRRTDLWNDEAKVSYIYLVNFGKVMAFYPIKGKVSSVNSQITNPAQLSTRWLDGRRGDGWIRVDGVIPSPAEDGSYGSNGDAVFFFTTDGTYVEWRGDYMLCDKPLKLATPPEMVIQVTE